MGCWYRLQAGHAVHEDEPTKTAQVILNFIARFRIGQPKPALPHAVFGLSPVLPQAAGPAL